MRLAMIDKLICPRCQHFPLDATIEREAAAPPLPEGYRCAEFCGDRQAPMRPGDRCQACAVRNIISGTLSCARCATAYPIADGIPNLIVPEQVDLWIGGEQQWWDDYYERLLRTTDVRQRRKNIAPERLPGIRYYERHRLLFRPFLRGFQRNQEAGKAILEIGAGMAETAANLFPPAERGYLYVGTDVSKPALQIAARLIPEGEFVQCTVDRLPFRPRSFQAAFCFGVLHHIPKWQESLELVLGLLKPGGLLLFEETIKKPRIFGRWRTESLTAAQDSPHEGDIDLGEFERIANRHGALTIRRHKSSPLRFGLMLIGERVINRAVVLTKLVAYLDYAWCRLLRPVSKSLGPGEIIGYLIVP